MTGVQTCALPICFPVTIAQNSLGDSTTRGGFFSVWRFGYSGATAGNRAFVGFSSTTHSFGVTLNPSATGPSATAVCIGFGFDAADTNWQVFARGSSVTSVTKTNTGMPKPVQNKFYEVAIFAGPSATAVSLSIEDLEGATAYYVSITASLPPANTLLAHRIWGNTGTSTTALSLDVVTMYLETDY